MLGLVVRTPGWAATDAGNPFSAAARPGRVRRVPADADRPLRARGARSGRRNPWLPRRPVRNWQIWNEPNIAINWDVQPWQRGYARLLRAAYPRGEGRRPRARRVVMAGLANFSWRDLSKAYRGGGQGSFDVAAVHPFSGRPSNSVKITRLNREVMDRNGDAPQADLADRADVVLGEGQEDAADAELGDDRGAARPQRLRAGLRAVRARARRRCGSGASSGTRGRRSTATRRTRSTTRACGRCGPTGGSSTSPRSAAFRAVVRRYG